MKPLASLEALGGDRRDVRPPSPLLNSDEHWRKRQAEQDRGHVLPCEDEHLQRWRHLSDLLLDCDGTISFTESFVYIGALLSFTDSSCTSTPCSTTTYPITMMLRLGSRRHPGAFGVLCSKIFSSHDIP
jgi:hypothetical protein